MRIYGADCALSKLPKMFLSIEEQAKIYKELYYYGYDTKTRYLGVLGDIFEAFKYIKNTTIKEFIESLTRAKALLPNDKFDMQKYA